MITKYNPGKLKRFAHKIVRSRREHTDGSKDNPEAYTTTGTRMFSYIQGHIRLNREKTTKVLTDLGWYK